MDESTIRGMKVLELNDGGAASRIPQAVISVEGYDTWLQEYTLKLALTKHFSSCGKITHVYVPRDYKRGILKSVAFMWITGEDCLDKALELSGTDVGGWIVIVKAAPSQKQLMDTNKPKQEDLHMVCVTGYDTSLPEIDLQMALCNHFSSCGEVFRVYFHARCARILLYGGTCVEKALKLSGCNMGGMNLVVEPGVTEGRKPRPRLSTGYMPLSNLLKNAENKKEKMEKEMEMVMDEKKKKKMKMELMKIDKEIRRLMEKKKKKDMDRRRMEMENF